jgi:dihydrofolate synthase / folylpolyglutamate synthase
MTPKTSRSFADWLTYIEQLHPQNIDMGLERVVQVYRRMQAPLSCAIITVGGTNGKGSTCAMLETILMQAGHRVGLYTSPHILLFNERARINGESASEDALIWHFEAVEAARGDTQLTYFEFTTLAILSLFAEASLDVAILEVGLGGRLDAVNIFDADVAIVTNVGIDHVEYLGDTREKIGFEKAGIFRRDRAAICGDFNPPESLLQHVQAIGADLWLAGRDFRSVDNGDKWDWIGRSQQYQSLAYPKLQGANQIQNASVALAALEALQQRLPVSDLAVRAGLAQALLQGRFQILLGKPTIILDVAHNPHAAAVLADNLDHMGTYQDTYAVFGAMRDKDIDGVIACMKDRVNHWCITDLPVPRAALASEICEKLLAAGFSQKLHAGKSFQSFSSPAEAIADALSRAGENDRIAVFGSFWTVAGVMTAERARHQ